MLKIENEKHSVNEREEKKMQKRGKEENCNMEKFTQEQLNVLNNTDIIAVDFDGVLCEHKFPKIGKPKKKVINWVKKQKLKGAKLILWTCRSGENLTDALQWCKQFNLEWDSVNEGIKEVQGMFKQSSPKVYANRYLDDKNITLEDIER